jgi:hypothetical protein
MVFSALVGLVAGVPFGTLLLRALLGGVFFGALVFGAIFVLRSMSPELFSPSDPLAADAGLADSLPTMGQNVDIVLGEGDEDADLAPGAAEGTGAEGEARLQPTGFRAVSTAVLDDEEGFDDAEQIGESLDDEVSEPAPAGAKPRRGASIAVPPPGSGLEDLDSLPDLESLSDAFSESPSLGGGDADSDRPARARPSGGGRGGGEDPAALAQAVRTLLKRDQKG